MNLPRTNLEENDELMVIGIYINLPIIDKDPDSHRKTTFGKEDLRHHPSP